MEHKSKQIASRSKPDLEASQVLLCGAAFIGAIQPIHGDVASTVGAELPSSLPILQRAPFLTIRCPRFTTSPSSIWMPLIMNTFQTERHKPASVIYQA